MAIIKDSIDNIQFLLDYCSKIPELYNDVANHLYDRFHIRSAEISLLVTYYIAQEIVHHHDAMINKLNSTYGLYVDTDGLYVDTDSVKEVQNGKNSTSDL